MFEYCIVSDLDPLPTPLSLSDRSHQVSNVVLWFLLELAVYSFFGMLIQLNINILAIPLMWKINLFKTDKAVYQYYFKPIKRHLLDANCCWFIIFVSNSDTCSFVLPGPFRFRQGRISLGVKVCQCNARHFDKQWIFALQTAVKFKSTFTGRFCPFYF